MPLCLLFIALLLLPSMVQATPLPAQDALILKHYTTKNGLTGNHIRSLWRDDRGLLWIGTNKGVTLFDGQTFRPLVSDLQSPLSSAVIFDIAQSADDSLWLATHYRGIFHYNPKTAEYRQYTLTSAPDQQPPAVRAITVDNTKRVWLATDKGLYQFKPDSQTFIQLGPKEKLNAIAAVDNDHLWLGSDNGVLYLNHASYALDRHLLGSLGKNKIRDVLLTDDQTLMVATHEGTFSRKSGASNFAPFGDRPKCTGRVNKMMTDQQNRVWTATDNMGACLFNLQSGASNRYESYEDQIETLRIDQVFDLLQDLDGNLWFGTKAGLSVWQKDVSAIESFTIKSANNQVLMARALWSDTPDTLIMLNFKHTLRLNKSDLKPVQIEPLKAGEFIAYTLYVPGYGGFAFKRNDGQLYRLDASTLQYLPTPFKLPASLAPYHGVSLHQVKRGVLGVGTEQNAWLIKLDDFSTTRLFGDLIDRKPEAVLALHQHRQTLWTCPGYHEFTAYNLNANQWQAVHSGITPSETLKCNRLVHSAQGVWGLSLRTVYRLGPHSNSIINEISEPGVATVIETGNHLWLIRADELVRYNLSGDDDNVRIKLEQLGSVSHLTRNNSYYDSSNGHLYILLSKRILRVDIDQIAPASRPLNVNLREFLLFNRPVPVMQSPDVLADATIGYSRALQLDYSQYMFQLSFAANVLANHKNVRYRYRLKGLDDSWIETAPDKAFAMYSGMSEGHYTFEVQATNHPTQWPEASTAIGLVITPPWWRTWWAWLLYVFAGAALLSSMLWLVYRQRLAEKDRQSALAISHAKQQFFANISHEFRTPLTLILGPITQLRQSDTHGADSSLLAMLERNAKRLAALVDQILDLAKLQSFAERTKQSQHIQPIADFVVHSFQSLVESRQITLQLHDNSIGPLRVSVLPDTVEKILINLLSNAVKYSPDGATITVTLAEQPKDQLELEVSDTGYGISEQDQAIIFDRFTRIENDTNNAPGTGIGLALVKELVQRHNGTLNVASQPGKGSRFTVGLPLSKSDESMDEVSSAVIENAIAALDTRALTMQAPVTPQPEFQGNKPQLLIVEDNPDMRAYIISHLADSYQCSQAENGEIGLKMAINNVPDLIISDLMMPKMDGLTLVQRLREEECTCHIPLILLTAKADADSRMQGWQQNVDDYIAKPFNAQELSLRVENLLSIRNILSKRFAARLKTVPSPAALPTEAADDKNRAFIEKFEQMMADNFHIKDFNRAQAAERMFMSERQLHRKLAALCDYTFSDYLRQVRLHQGRKLVGKGYQVGEIAEKVGYSSTAYFGSCFKAEFGMTVKQYEKTL